MVEDVTEAQDAGASLLVEDHDQTEMISGVDEALDVGAGPVEADNPSDMALRIPRLPTSSP